MSLDISLSSRVNSRSSQWHFLSNFVNSVHISSSFIQLPYDFDFLNNGGVLLVFSDIL